MLLESIQSITNTPEPIRTINVNIEPKGFHALLVRLRLSKPKTKPVELIYSLSSMLTFQRISELVLSLTTGGESHFELYNSNSTTMAAIIATAIHNDPSPVPSELVDAILKNFTNAELHNTAQKVYRGLDYTPFYNTMELFLNLMPTDTREMTQSGLSSEIPK